MNISVGDEVIDDLTGTRCRVTKMLSSILQQDSRAIGIWVDHPYLEGARHPWEITTTK